MRRASNRIAPLAAAATLLLLAIAPGTLPGGVARAADRGLVVVAQARYVAFPGQRRVHVTIDAVATSYTPNPVDGLAYYPDVTIPVQPGATHVAATSAGQFLSVSADRRNPDFVSVTVTFAQGVFFEESYPFRLSFDLPDPGGAPDRNLRISPSIVAFPVWAFGSSGEPGGSVTVTLPAGFRPVVQGDAMAASTGANGEIVLSTTSLPDPFSFFAYLSADRPGAFNDTLVTVEVGDKPAPVQVRAWQDDPEWGTTMVGLMTDGLPALQKLIGLTYPTATSGKLVVEEAATSRLGEYAGIYNKLDGIIRVRYDADAYVGLHEAAHIWFNGDLFRDRWVDEAWAEFYGVRAAMEIGASGRAFVLTDDLLANKIPLNDWGEIGAVQIGVEEYAYAATYHLAGLIFDRTSIPGLQAVWRGADASEMAYQPAHSPGAPQTGVGGDVEGWQQLLDLLDQRAGANFDDLWSEWVVNPTEQRELDARATAREQYARLVEDAGAWNLPRDLRFAMGSWKFDDAEADMTLATTVLDVRDQVVSAAGRLDLSPPTQLEQLFERDGGLKAAQAEADLEIAVLGDIATTTTRLGEKETILESIGLLGADPAADLDAARTAFEADDLHVAGRDADQALAARTGAAEAGQTRVLLAGGGVLVLSGATFVGVRVRRRRRRVASPETAAERATAPETTDGSDLDEPLEPPA
jgi:hypothetical protein